MANKVKEILRQLRNLGHREYPLTTDDLGALMFGKGSWRTNKALNLSTVYRCVTCISDSIAQLPLEIYSVDDNGYKKKLRKHPLFRVLNAKPNARMTRYVWIDLIVRNILLEGNGYSYIKRNTQGIPVELIYIPAGYVNIIYPSTLDAPVKYMVSGESANGGTWSQVIEAKDMLHFTNHTNDGVYGVSVLTYAKDTLGLSSAAEKHAANFFLSGCGVGGILKSNTILDKEQKKAIKESWNAVFRDGMNSNGVAVLGADVEYQPVTVNAKDAQLLETRQFNVIDICRFFGVSPVKAFDLTKSSYSTVEATNIGFLTDTVSPLLEKIELEIETKLFKPEENIDARFDVSQLLRADKQSLASYYSTMYNIGAYSLNEIRREIDLPAVEYGDINFVPVNLQSLKNAAESKPQQAPGDQEREESKE